MSYASVVLADAPVSFWRLGEAVASGSATAFDSSGHAHNITYQNGCDGAQVGGVKDADTAVLFDGISAHVVGGGAPVGFDGTGACSMELWFKATAAAPARRALVTAGYGHASGVAGFNLDLTATQIIAEVRSTASTEAAFTVTYADLHWHYVIMTLTRGTPDVLRLYLDGVLVATTNCATAGLSIQPNPAFNFYLATDQALTGYYAGLLDEVALYNVALTPTRIRAHYAAGAIRTYTFRIRHGSDLQIRDTVGEAPTTLSLVVQGDRPPGNGTVRIGLEPDSLRLAAKIAGSDAAPGLFDVATEPLLFEGVLQTVEEHYNGLPTQLAWACTAIDHVYELNKRRPFGTFEDVAGHVVVETIMGTYAPEFDLAFVQQIAVTVTISFDGTRDMSECLSAIAAQLGGCHWYLDLFALHFYHVGINDGDVAVSTFPAPPDPLTAPTLTGVARPIPPGQFAGWSLFAMTYVYSNGLESQPSDNLLVDVDDTYAIDFTALPLGAPVGGLSVVKRYLYQYVLNYIGGEAAKRFVFVIPDNTSTTYRVDGVGPLRRRVPPPRDDPAPPPSTAATVTASGSSGSAAGGSYAFAVAYLYETGVESVIGPWSTPLVLVGTEDMVTLASVPVGPPNVDGDLVLVRTIYLAVGGVPAWGVAFIPNNTATDWDLSMISPGMRHFQEGRPAGSGSFVEYGFYRTPPPTSGGETFGPSLEDDLEQPDPLTDDSPTLIHHNPPLTSSEDASQLRTRVWVTGASWPLISAVADTDHSFEVETAAFDPAGGMILVGGDRYTFTSISGGRLWLPSPETVGKDYPLGTLVSILVQCDDFAAQAELGEREAVAGVPTDGVREFTIVDTSLDSVAACLARGYAELALYARPILTVHYGTFDRKTRAGRRIAIDLTDPPLQHDGLLIQEVTIDHIEVGPTTWSPRYTVTASSVRFTLDDLLRRVSLDR